MVGGDVPPFGFDSAGLNEHNVNAELSCLHAQRVRKGLHRVLCSVVPASHKGDEPPAHARDIDDRARSLLAHTGHDGLRQSGEAEDVDIELAASLVDLDVFNRSEGSVARVVHQHIDAPAFGDDPPDGVLACLLVSDIKLNGAHAVFGERLHLFDAPGCAIDGMTLQSQLFCRLEPHAAACPGDEDDLLDWGFVGWGFAGREFIRHCLPFMLSGRLALSMPFGSALQRLALAASGRSFSTIWDGFRCSLPRASAVSSSSRRDATVRRCAVLIQDESVSFYGLTRSLLRYGRFGK